MSGHSSDKIFTSLPLRWAEPPHWRGIAGEIPMTLTLTAAACAANLAGFALFGWHAVRILVIAVLSAMIIESVFNLYTWRRRPWSRTYALPVGALFACTMPPTAHWQVIVFGTAIAVLVGQLVQGGVGNYVWQPVALGRVAIQILFGDEMTPARWPVLAPERLFSGNLYLARDLPPLGAWHTQPLPPGVEAWLVERPVDILHGFQKGISGEGAGKMMADWLADRLPPWWDTIIGAAGGATGEACILVVMVAGLFLMWQGFLRWTTILAGAGSACFLAMVLPIHFQIPGQTAITHWLPGLTIYDGLPVGLVYVAYQLSAGAFPFVLLILAADPTCSPFTSRGHFLFGLVIGTATMVLRVLLGLPAAEYWALLGANTCVPVINRLTRRRVLGSKAK